MLNSILNGLLLVLAGATAIPVAVVFLECLAALLPRRTRREGARPRIDVLIPAHNEEAVIGATLRSVGAQLRDGDRLLVVADNCADRTAEAALSSGAIVVERTSETERGKGYALDCGVRRLAEGHADVVVIVDADCTLGPGTLDALARDCAASGRPVQAGYLMHAPPNPSPRDVVSRFAVVVKNQVRQRGLTALGGAAVLTGSGMAFPWSVLSRAKLASGNIVEDMQLSFDLLVAGHEPRFCPSAEVHAPLPAARKASMTQRTRWEHGHLQTLMSRVPRLAWEGARQRRPRLWVSALDLAVPPLALLCTVWCGATLLAAASAAVGFGRTALVVNLVSGTVLVGCIALVAAAFVRDVSFTQLALAVPRYIAGKLPIYYTFLFRRQTVWVRTDRAEQPPHHHGPSQPLHSQT